jgi:energy-coupling factor transport system permease protein
MSTEAFVKYFGYRPGTSIFHRLDPRTKIIFYGTFLLIAVAGTDPLFLLSVLLVLIALYIIAGESFKRILVLLLVPFPGYILIFLYNLFLFDVTAGKAIPWDLHYIGWVIPKIGSFGPYGHVSIEGLIFATQVSFRLAIFILASRFLILTTAPQEIIIALRKLGLPYIIGFSLSLGLAYIPELARQVGVVIEAQSMRGWKLGSKANPVNVVRSFAPVVIPVILRSIIRAEYLAAAMTSRGYGLSKNPIMLREISFNKLDYAMIAASMTAFVVAIIISPWVLNIANFKFTTFLLVSK